MTNCHSLQTIENLKPGDHLCCLYETDEEHRQVLTPFLRKGLQQGEKVLYIADTHSVETVLGYLRDGGVDADPYLDSGQLVIVSSDDAYMCCGVFDPDRMITLLRTETEQSLSEGYAGLRVTGEMTWAIKSLPRPERLIEYENKLNQFFPGSRCLAICQYDRRRFDPAQLLEALRTHPVAVIGTSTYDNCYYVPPADLLSTDPASAELARCVQHLAERRHMEETLRESEGMARALLNANTDLAAVLDTDGIILDLNEAMARYWNMSMDELVGVNVWELLPPDVTAHRKPYGDQVISSGKPVRFEDEGQGIWFDSVVYPVLDARGEVTKIAVHSRDITERVRAEMALRESEEMARALLNAHTDVAAVLDTSGTILDANEAMARSLGMHIDELVGVIGWELLPPDLGERRKAYGDTVIQSGKPVRFEDERQGTWFDNLFYLILDAQGEVTKIAVHARDITERVRAEMALRDSEAKYRTLVEQLPVITYIAESDDDSSTLYISPQIESLLGFSQDEWTAIPDLWARQLHPGDRTRVLDELAQSNSRGEPFRSEYRMFASDGSVLWFRDEAAAIRQEDGQAHYYQGVMFDITERKQAEETLRESEATARALLEAHTDFAAVLDNNGIILDLNEAMARSLGRPLDELVGVNVWDLFPPDISERRKAYGDQVIQSGQPVRFEDECQGRWFDIVCYPIVNAQGEVTKLAVNARDTTERVQTEIALQEAKELFETTFSAQRDAILLLDSRRPPEILDCNPATEEVFGYTREEMLGRTTVFLHVTEASLVEFEAHLFKAVEEHGYVHLLEAQLKRKDGTIFPAEYSVMPIQDQQGNRTGWVGVVRDITERVRANEEALQHREQLAHIMRVASMGELTASLAHELNQPLTAVVSNAQAAQRFLAHDAPDLDEVRGALTDIADNGLRAGSVIRGLRALLRKGELKQEPLDINEIVSEVVPLVQSEAALYEVSIELQLANGLPHISGDRIQLEQVVLNLLLNGIEALKELDACERELTVQTEQAAPDEVELAVLDSGAGLDEQIQDRIFDAFFSTKPGGLGMGLTINRSIVRAHNGQMWAAKNPGGGAAFHVRFPVSEEF